MHAMTYEGYVKFADDSVFSLQCALGVHGECPDPQCHDPEADWGSGPLAGYNCECDGSPGPAIEVTQAKCATAIAATEAKEETPYDDFRAGRASAAKELLRQIRANVEQGDGSWPGGDLVEFLCSSWFPAQGVNVEDGD